MNVQMPFSQGQIQDFQEGHQWVLKAWAFWGSLAIPAFWDKFCIRLIIIFASKLCFCKKKIQKGGTGPPGSATVSCPLFPEFESKLALTF